MPTLHAIALVAALIPAVAGPAPSCVVRADLNASRTPLVTHSITRATSHSARVTPAAPRAGMFGFRESSEQTGRADTVRGRLELTIGDASTLAPFGFGAISGVALDREGRIYVADLQETHVVVFATTGKLLATIGRKGAGPGEFEGPSGPAIGADGSLFVRDVAKIARFIPDPATGIATKHDRDFRGPLYPNWTSRRASRVDRSGRFNHPVMSWKTGGEVRHALLRYSAQGTLVDSIQVPAYANEPSPTASVRLSASGGRMVRGLNFVPFAAVPVWDVTMAGTIISGDALSYLLVETDAAGRVLRRFERAVPAQRIDRGERADSARALQRRIDSLPIPIARVDGVPEAVKTQTLPANYPPYTAVFAAEDGRVWVRRWPPAGRGRETFFDVFEADARFAGTVVLPVALAGAQHPVIRSDVLVGVVVDPETDLESVVRVRFDLRR